MHKAFSLANDVCRRASTPASVLSSRRFVRGSGRSAGRRAPPHPRSSGRTCIAASVERSRSACRCRARRSARSASHYGRTSRWRMDRGSAIATSQSISIRRLSPSRTKSQGMGRANALLGSMPLPEDPRTPAASLFHSVQGPAGGCRGCFGGGARPSSA